MPTIVFTYYPPGFPERARLAKIRGIADDNINTAMISAAADARYSRMIRADFRLVFDTEAEEIRYAMVRDRLDRRACRAITAAVCGDCAAAAVRVRLTRDALAAVTREDILAVRGCGVGMADRAMAWIRRFLAARPEPAAAHVEAATVNARMALAVDNKKRFVRIQDTGVWHWHDSGAPETLSGPFPTFLAALDDAVMLHVEVARVSYYHEDYAAADE